MPGFSNSRANLGFVKQRYNQNKAAGEKLIGSEYWLVIRGYEKLSILVRTAQIPEITREDVEDFAPGGAKFTQHGPFRNSGETQVQCAETIDGTVLKTVRDLVFNKRYVNVDLYLASESKGGPADSPACSMEDVKIYCDAVDFASEDVTAVVRPGLRLVYNWLQ